MTSAMVPLLIPAGVVYATNSGRVTSTSRPLGVQITAFAVTVGVRGAYRVADGSSAPFVTMKQGNPGRIGRAAAAE